MGKPGVRFVCKAVPGTGWRIWDRIQKKWWGKPSCQYPTAVLKELNGPKRPERLAALGEHR